MKKFIQKAAKTIFGFALAISISQNVLAIESSNQFNIGLLIVATGKYIEFVAPLIQSAEKHFCRNHKVTYFIFTDGDAPKSENVVTINQKRLGWPYDTMMRFAMYADAKERIQCMDYVFACDADMLFVDTVGDEILGDRVGTLHPGFVGSKGTYETRNASTAYIPNNQGKYYFAGGFNGGKTEEFVHMAHTMTQNIKRDLENGIVAVWHDESHLNRYYVNNEPTVILSPSYCMPDYPDHMKGPWSKYPRKLLALVKNHSEYRN